MSTELTAQPPDETQSLSPREAIQLPAHGGYRPRTHQTGAPEGIDLRAIWDALWRHKTRIALVVASATIAAWALSGFLTPRYEAKVRLRVDGDGLDVLHEGQRDPNAYVDALAIASQINSITGLEILQQVVRDTGIRYFPKFNPELSKAGKKDPDKIAVSIGVNDSGARDDRAIVTAFASAVAAVQVGQSGVAEVAVRAPDPMLAARAANDVGETYIAHQILEARTRRLRALDALTAQRDELNKELVTLEREIVRLREGSRLVFSEQKEVAGEVYSQIRQNLIASEADLAEAEARRQILDRAKNNAAGAEQLSEIALSDLMQRLKEQRAKVLVDLAQVSADYGPKHPQYVKLKDSLNDLDRAIKDELTRLSDAVRNQERILRDRVNKLRSRLQGLEVEATNQTQGRVQLERFSNEANGLRDSLQKLKTEIDNVKTSVGLEQSRASFVSRAIPPDKPAFPNRPLIAGAAFMASAGLSVLFVAARALFDRRIRTVSQLSAFEKATGCSMIGALPLQPEGFDPRSMDPRYGYSQGVMSVASALGLGPQNPMRIVVCPLKSGDGGTSLSVSLAALCARVGLKTLLVELDPNREVAQMFGGETNPGLSDCAAQGIDPTAAIWPSSEPGLDVLAHGLADDGFGGRTMAAIEQIFDRITSIYEVVIFDAPALATWKHAARLARRADQTLVVSLPDVGRADLLAFGLRSLGNEASKSIQIVLNQVPPNTSFDT